MSDSNITSNASINSSTNSNIHYALPVIRILKWRVVAPHASVANTPFGEFLFIKDATRVDDQWVLKDPTGKIIDYYRSCNHGFYRAQTVFEHAVKECFD